MRRLASPLLLAWGASLGLAVGSIFGFAFGIIASCFRGGPSLLHGVLESVPFFAIAFAVAGGLLTLERKPGKT